MGAFFGSIHVRTNDPKPVLAAVAVLAKDGKTRFYVSPSAKGWVTVFPSGAGQSWSVSEELSRLMPWAMLHCVVHDDDVFAFQFRREGVVVHEYDSNPSYFDTDESVVRPPPKNDYAALGEFLLDPSQLAELKRLLAPESAPGDFEQLRLEHFARLLGLPNACSSYELLEQGERDGVGQWRGFVHVPDLTDERRTKRAAKAEAKAKLRQMAKDGLLVLEKGDGRTTPRRFPSAPVWCIDPGTSDVLLAWAGAPIGPATPTRLGRINARTGTETATGVEVSGHVHCLAVNSTGSWIAAGCAYGDWKTQVWDLSDGTLMTEIPQSRAVTQVCFSQDGQTLFSLSENTITVADLSGARETRTVLLAEAGRTMVLHPAGEYLAVESQGMLAVAHLPTGRVLKRLWIPEPPGPQRDLLEQVAASGMERRFLSTIGETVSKQEMEAARARMAQHFLPKQSVFSLSFGPSGNHLFCGTTAGLCVLEWAKILAASELASIDPLVFVRAEPLVREDDLPDNQLIYSVLADPVAKRILFAGLEGKVRFLNIADGRVGDLLTPPTIRPFWHLELTPDRTALVGTSIPRQQGNKPEPPSFQIWSYEALCRLAGLNF